MNFSYDIFNNIESIQIILCKNNLEKVGVLGLAYDKKITLRLTDLSEFSFTYPQKVDNVITPYYDNIKTKKIIYIPEIGYFKLERVKIESDGIKEFKSCTAYSIQVELKQKQLINFSGTYKLYDPISPQDSLIGILIDYFPNWSIDSVDSNLWGIYRTFDITEKDIYSFCMDDLMNSYNCVILFDIQNRKISVKSLENVSKETDIYISFDNLIKSAEIEELSEEIVTALRVKGGSDNMDIIAVNPNGTDTIYNFSYYKTLEWMSQGLIDALNSYETKYNSLKLTYSTKLTTLKDKNTLLSIKEGELIDLENELSALITVKKVKIQDGLSLTDINSQISAKNSQITTKKNEINSLKSEISVLQTDLNNIVNQLKFENNFTNTQLLELDSLIIQQPFQDSTFIITSNMSETDILEQKQELYNFASNVLVRLAQPRFSFSISSSNFVMLKSYEKFTQQLELGCLITTELREDYIIKPILLEIEIDFEQENNFNLRFGNKFKLTDGTFSLADLMSQSSNTSATISLEKFSYKDWSKNSKDSVTQFINSSLNCAKNAVTSSENQEVLINEHGVQCREIDTSTGQFKTEQLWIVNNMIAMSKDSFNTAEVAIGKIQDNRYGTLWGISAPLLVGRVLTGNNLRIENSKNQFVLDESGCVLTNASFTLTTTDNTSKAIITPSFLKFQGNIGGTWTDQLYFNNGNLKIKGELVAGSIISNSTITGGSLNINNKCIIDSSGYLTATGANITGKINATSGEISGNLNITGSLNGGVINGATINTTKDINVGDSIYLNATTYNGKGLYFTPDTRITYVGLNGMTIASGGNIDISSGGDVLLTANGNIKFVSYNNGCVIIPYKSYLGVEYDSNKIVKKSDLGAYATLNDLNGFITQYDADDRYIRPMYSANLCYIDFSESLMRLNIRDISGNYVGSISITP